MERQYREGGHGLWHGEENACWRLCWSTSRTRGRGGRSTPRTPALVLQGAEAGRGTRRAPARAPVMKGRFARRWASDAVLRSSAAP